MLPRLIAIIVPILTAFVFGASGGIIGPLRPGLAQDLHVSMADSSILFSIFFTGALLATTIGGFLADRFGKKLLFAIMLALFTVSFFTLAVAPTFAIAALACFLIGASGGTLEGLCSAIIADIDPAHVNRNMNLLQVAFSAGAVGALFIVSWLLARDISWRVPYLVLGSSAVLLFLSSLFMARPPVHDEERMSIQVARRVFSDRAVVLLAVAIALYVGSEMSLAWLSSRVLELQYHYTEAGAAQIATLFWLTMGIGRVAVGGLAHRVSGYRLLCWLVAGGLLSYVVLFLPFGAIGMWVGVGLAGLTFSGIWPLLVGLGANRYPAYTGTVVALLVSSGTAGGLIFPAVGGYFLESRPVWSILLLMAVLFVLLAVVLWRYGRHDARTANAVPDEAAV